MLETWDWARAAGFASVLAVALSGSLFWALYYSPPPLRDAVEPQEAHDGPIADQTAEQPRGTASAPVIVKVLPPAPGTPEAAQVEAEREQKASIERGLLWFTAVLAVATMGLMFATVGLVAFAKDQSHQTKILQRAYVTADPGGIDVYRSADGRLSCDIVFQNSGNLPARNVRWCIDRQFSIDNKLLEFPIDQSKIDGNNLIPPKGKMRKGGPAINSAELDAFRHEVSATTAAAGNHGWLYVWGQVRYKDGFDVDRFTNFCFRYSLAGTSWTISARHGRQHEHGNGTDEGA
jgi:hypothetical protein